MALIQDNLGKPATELSETLTKHTTFIVLRFLTKHLQPSFPPSLPLGFNAKDNLGNTWKKHEEQDNKNQHFARYTGFW